MLSRVVFGFSDAAAIAIGAIITVNFMVFMVPAEQIMWSDELLCDYIRSRREELMAVKHTASMIGSAGIPIVVFLVPTAAFVLPVLTAADVDKVFTSGMQADVGLALYQSFGWLSYLRDGVLCKKTYRINQGSILLGT